MTDDPTTTARLDTTDPDRPRGDVRGLGDARLRELAEVLARHRLHASLNVCLGCNWRYVLAEGGSLADQHEAHRAAALEPLVAGWIAEERAGVAERLTRVTDLAEMWIHEHESGGNGRLGFHATEYADVFAADLRNTLAGDA